MKKLLIATTALVATAGVAAADVKVTGDGRMGVVYDGGSYGDKSSLNFSSRVRVQFELSGETDGGLQFGGKFRAHQAGGAAEGQNGLVYISGAFGRLEMGDTVSAAEKMIGDLPEIGYTDRDSAWGFDNDITYITGDRGGIFGRVTDKNNPVVLYTYSSGPFAVAASFSDGNWDQTDAKDIREMSIAGKYSWDAYAVSLGYEAANTRGNLGVLAGGNTGKHLILGGDATFADTTVKAFYGHGSGNIKGYKQYGLGVSSTFDAITVKGFIKRDEIKAGSNADLNIGGNAKVTSYGIGADYALGGGATLAGGLVDDNVAGSKVRADIGIKFAF